AGDSGAAGSGAAGSGATGPQGPGPDAPGPERLASDAADPDSSAGGSSALDSSAPASPLDQATGDHRRGGMELPPQGALTPALAPPYIAPPGRGTGRRGRPPCPSLSRTPGSRRPLPSPPPMAGRALPSTKRAAFVADAV